MPIMPSLGGPRQSVKFKVMIKLAMASQISIGTRELPIALNME